MYLELDITKGVFVEQGQFSCTGDPVPAPKEVVTTEKVSRETAMFSLVKEMAHAINLTAPGAVTVWKAERGVTIKLSLLNFSEFNKLFPSKREKLHRLIRLARSFAKAGINSRTITLRKGGGGCIFFAEK